MKALLGNVLQREAKQDMVAKWQVFSIAILLGKGISYYKHYEKISSKLFANFIENNFIDIFTSSCNPAGNVFVQDDDLSQNYKAGKTALDKTSAVQFSIIPHSPGLNTIENAFNLVEKNLSSDAVKHFISKESYAKFMETVENTLLSYPIVLLDNIIKSVPKRISKVIQRKGHRLKH